jgi:serine/threonine protein kinase
MAKSLGSKYILQEALGRGAMGQVFAGSIRPGGEPVAIKVLRPELVSDPEVVARFVQERTILMSIADPHVVQVIDLVVEGDTLAVVMELIQGCDLRRQLRARGTVPPAEALHLTGQLLRGAAAVHAAGIVHRDIKPENVLVDTSNGRPWLKLTDFGVARLSYGGSLTKLSGLIGTPEYMAPELAEHSRATPAADIYSAGIVLYEMLCGRTPFAGGHPVAVLRRQADQAPPVIPGVPAELWDPIAWMLAKDPGARPSSAAEAYAALAPLQAPLAAQPALAPWAGPESWTPAQTAPPAAQTMTAPGRVGLQDHGGPVPGATVLRHRHRGEVAAPGDPGGLRPPGAEGGLLAHMQMPVTSSSRRKRQAGVAVLAVALATVLGLVTTMAMAAIHHRSASQHPAADGRRTAALKASVSPAAASASGRRTGARATASGGGGGTASGGGAGTASGGTGGSTSSPSCQPKITAVGPFEASASQTVVIDGSCFGTGNTTSAADTAYFEISDLTTGWGACFTDGHGPLLSIKVTTSRSRPGIRNPDTARLPVRSSRVAALPPNALAVKPDQHHSRGMIRPPRPGARPPTVIAAWAAVPTALPAAESTSMTRSGPAVSCAPRRVPRQSGVRYLTGHAARACEPLERTIGTKPATLTLKDVSQNAANRGWWGAREPFAGQQRRAARPPGRGATGEVFRGTVRESWAPVAVKVPKADLAADSEVASRLVRERSILTSISHPHVETVPRGLILHLTRGRRGLVLEPSSPADGISFSTRLPVAVTGVPKLPGDVVSNRHVTAMQMPELAESPNRS